jgi:hypothetical protein
MRREGLVCNAMWEILEKCLNGNNRSVSAFALQVAILPISQAPLHKQVIRPHFFRIAGLNHTDLREASAS